MTVAIVVPYGNDVPAEIDAAGNGDDVAIAVPVIDQTATAPLP